MDEPKTYTARQVGELVLAVAGAKLVAGAEYDEYSVEELHHRLAGELGAAIDEFKCHGRAADGYQGCDIERMVAAAARTLREARTFVYDGPDGQPLMFQWKSPEHPAAAMNVVTTVGALRQALTAIAGAEPGTDFAKLREERDKLRKEVAEHVDLFYKLREERDAAKSSWRFPKYGEKVEALEDFPGKEVAFEGYDLKKGERYAVEGISTTVIQSRQNDPGQWHEKAEPSISVPVTHKAGSSSSSSLTLYFPARLFKPLPQ